MTWRKIGVHIDAFDFRVLDLSTGLNVRHCIEANDETGVYRVYESDENDKVITPLNVLTKRGKIKLYIPGG